MSYRPLVKYTDDTGDTGVQRKLFPQKIKEYVLGDSKQPLVVHGESGCGKTSIMALAAEEAFHWLHGNGMVVMR